MWDNFISMFMHLIKGKNLKIKIPSIFCIDKCDPSTHGRQHSCTLALTPCWTRLRARCLRPFVRPSGVGGANLTVAVLNTGSHPKWAEIAQFWRPYLLGAFCSYSGSTPPWGRDFLARLTYNTPGINKNYGKTPGNKGFNRRTHPHGITKSIRL